MFFMHAWLDLANSFNGAFNSCCFTMSGLIKWGFMKDQTWCEQGAWVDSCVWTSNWMVIMVWTQGVNTWSIHEPSNAWSIINLIHESSNTWMTIMNMQMPLDCRPLNLSMHAPCINSLHACAVQRDVPSHSLNLHAWICPMYLQIRVHLHKTNELN